MLTDRTTYRRTMLAHCLELARLGTEYAMQAADWYEANEPDLLDGLGARVRRELSPKAATC